MWSQNKCVLKIKHVSYSAVVGLFTYTMKTTFYLYNEDDFFTYTMKTTFYLYNEDYFILIQWRRLFY